MLSIKFIKRSERNKIQFKKMKSYFEDRILRFFMDGGNLQKDPVVDFYRLNLTRPFGLYSSHGTTIKHFFVGRGLQLIALPRWSAAVGQ